MEASRELDAIVAEKIMGYLWWHRSEGCNQLYEPGSAEWAADMELIPGKHETEYPPVLGVPHYSTDIAAAWTLIERHPFYVYIARVHGFWQCNFYAPEAFKATADTAPLAICLAALKAAEVDGALTK